ncbi:MAG: hypothetical protein QM743_02000, partial [Chitinophagaceae bacterium]
MNWLNSLGTAVILGIGGYLVIQGRTEIGTVVAFVAGLAKINNPCDDIGELVSRLSGDPGPLSPGFKCLAQCQVLLDSIVFLNLSNT